MEFLDKYGRTNRQTARATRKKNEKEATKIQNIVIKLFLCVN